MKLSQLNTLRKQTARFTREHGHRMKWGPISFHISGGLTQTGKCKCGEEAILLTNSQHDIGGMAIWYECALSSKRKSINQQPK